MCASFQGKHAQWHGLPREERADSEVRRPTAASDRGPPSPPCARHASRPFLSIDLLAASGPAASPLSRPKPPKAVAEGQPLQGIRRRPLSNAKIDGPPRPQRLPLRLDICSSDGEDIAV